MLTLIRHTSPGIAKGICYGQSDIDISRNYPQELQIIKNKIIATDQTVYSSPLKRCTKLASDLFTYFNTDHRLMELDFGDWELKRWDDINDEFSRKWFADYINTATPNGESCLQMYDRVKEFYEQKILPDNDNITIVTHAGVMRILLSIINNISLPEIFDIKIDYGGIIIIQ